MPILGTIASGISGHLTPPYSSSYDSIATVIPTGSSNTVTFNSIPTDYQHLQIRGYSQNSSSYMSMNYNGDYGASSYGYNYWESSGGATLSYGGNASTTNLFIFATSNTQANHYGVFVIDIYDYDDTSKYKGFRSISGTKGNSGGINYVDYDWGIWKSNTAINSITLTTAGGNWTTGSSFALYGLKG